MNEIKLEAKSQNEKIILAYLKEFATPMLVERINAGPKTLAQCWNYIMAEARKSAVNGCACIEDKVVYGWATHFFEEEDIDGEKYNKSVAAKVAKSIEDEQVKKERKYEEKVIAEEEKKTKPKSKKADVPQLDQFSFDDLFG